ncbi:MAG: hypothetical protein GY703_23000 [Gammaproteobacteria bacterium]|nr:hypothetical protein [Gammaproteobacteria bacterium]
MNQLKSTKREEKVFWMTGVFFFLLLGLGGASIHFLLQINSELKVVLEREIPITEMITRITVHKLEQTSWLERALRHSQIAAHGQQNNEENTKLLNEAKARFKEITVKVNEEIDNASEMSTEALKLAQTEEMKDELRRVENFLASVREEYTDYIDRINKLFALFVNGKIADAEQVANETEELDEDFNQRLEAFLFDSEKITRHSLSSIGDREGKTIIVIAVVISIALLFTIVALLIQSIYVVSRKMGTSRHGRDNNND